MASGMPLSNCHSDDEVWARAVASTPRDVRWGRAVWTRLRPAYSRSRRRNGGDHQVAERRVARRVHREIDRVRRRPSAGPWRCSRPLQPYGQDRAAGGSRLATVTRPWIRKGRATRRSTHLREHACRSTAPAEIEPPSPRVERHAPARRGEHDPSGRIGVRKSQPPTTAASTAASRSSSVDVHVEGDPPQGQRPEKRTASATKHQHRLLHHHIEVIERRPRHALAPSEFGCHASDVTRPADLQPNDLRVCNTPEPATSSEDVLGPGRAASGNIPTSATREIRSAQLAPGEPHLDQTVERLASGSRLRDRRTSHIPRRACRQTERGPLPVSLRRNLWSGHRNEVRLTRRGCKGLVDDGLPRHRHPRRRSGRASPAGCEALRRRDAVARVERSARNRSARKPPGRRRAERPWRERQQPIPSRSPTAEGTALLRPRDELSSVPQEKTAAPPWRPTRFPPVVVAPTAPDSCPTVATASSCRKAGPSEIAAHVHHGTREDALWFTRRQPRSRQATQPCGQAQCHRARLPRPA